MAKKQVQGKRYTSQSLNNKPSDGLVDYGKHKESSWKKSTKDQLVRVPKYTQEQLYNPNTINKFLASKQQEPGVNSSNLEKALYALNLPQNSNNNFENYRNEALSSYENKTIPLLAQRITGMTNGAPSSSSINLGRSLAQGRNELAGQLAGLEAQYGLQNQQQQTNNLLSLLDRGGASQYDIANIAGRDSGIRSALKGGITGAINFLSNGGFQGFGNQNGNTTLMQNQSNFGNAGYEPNYQAASMNQYLQQQQNFSPNKSPQSIIDSLVEGLGQQNGPQGFGSQNKNKYNPYDVVNATVRGFGKRTY